MSKPTQQTDETTGTVSLPNEPVPSTREESLESTVRRQDFDQMACTLAVDLANARLEFDTRLNLIAAAVSDNERFLRIYSSAASICIIILFASQAYLFSRLL